MRPLGDDVARRSAPLSPPGPGSYKSPERPKKSSQLHSTANGSTLQAQYGTDRRKDPSGLQRNAGGSGYPARQ